MWVCVCACMLVCYWFNPVHSGRAVGFDSAVLTLSPRDKDPPVLVCFTWTLISHTDSFVPTLSRPAVTWSPPSPHQHLSSPEHLAPFSPHLITSAPPSVCSPTPSTSVQSQPAGNPPSTTSPGASSQLQLNLHVNRWSSNDRGHSNRENNIIYLYHIYSTLFLGG